MNPVVVVHGGGPEISELMRRLGKELEFLDGLRVTDAETVDIARTALVGRSIRHRRVAEPARPRTRSGSRGGRRVLIQVETRDAGLGFVGGKIHQSTHRSWSGSSVRSSSR